MVEEAELHRADVQRIADRFSAWYLPVVASIAALTLLITHNPLSMAAVMVVACSCSFALATPIAMLASVGAAAKRGLLFKGGKYIETLAKADTLLVDKTGTLTLGRPQLTDIIVLHGAAENEVLALAAAVERDSEHPLAEAVRVAARERNLSFDTAEQFASIVGQGVRANVKNHVIAVGNQRMVAGAAHCAEAGVLEVQGKTVLFVAQDDVVVGMLAVADTVRPEIAAAIALLRSQGIARVENADGRQRTGCSSAGTAIGNQLSGEPAARG